MDIRQLRKDRAEGWAEDDYSAMPAVSVPAPSANDEVFPWATEFRDEPTYLETLLGKEASDVSTEPEDCQRIEQNEENLFLSEVQKLSVKKL